MKVSLKLLLIFLVSFFSIRSQVLASAKVKIGFDHTYVTTNDISVWKGLGDRGFLLSESAVKHPGGVECRFINLSGGLREAGQYLEFCEVIDEKEAEKSNQNTHHSVKERYEWGVGLSLNASGGLEELYNNRKENFSNFGLKFKHKNYDWQKDSKSRLPGWNFLSFDDQELVQGFYTWVTEYENKKKKKKKKKRKKRKNHPNGVEKIAGVLLYGEYRPDLRDLADFVGVKYQKNQVVLDDGVKVFSYSVSELPELKKILMKKRTIFGAVIFKVKSLVEFDKTAKPDVSGFLFNGKKASIIKLGHWHWDLLFVEDDI